METARERRRFDGMTRTLIAYATVEGHTATIAEFMRDELEAADHEVTLLEIRDGSEELPPDVDAVIVGGSIHAGHHKKALVAFAKANRDRLAELSAGFFTVCLSALDDSDEGRTTTAEYVQAFRTATGWEPRHAAVFPGRLAWTQYDVFTRLLMRVIMRGRGSGDRDVHRDYDYTDYDAVRRFARMVLQTPDRAAVA
jgi:menaquinone-dependent protoporphyrinogen oxidase